ncbi:hypothetical protein ILYODFUR_019901 [Ilyodon furcidens]|uniref:Uncharacterized protein n=1 Tax=Ilyodon furcidens TaxID=33524 RepID=A0ABV0UB10_9TELE
MGASNLDSFTQISVQRGKQNGLMESEVADLELPSHPKEVAHCGALHAVFESLNEWLIFSIECFDYLTPLSD